MPRRKRTSPSTACPFEEAATALVDPNAIFLADAEADEERLVAIGMSKQTRILFVVHVVRRT
jgi:uncharacterized DUF497 family protein